MEYSDEHKMLTLSFLSYLGFYDTTLGVQRSERTLKSIQEYLRSSSVLKTDDFEVVWGPAMYRLPLTVFDENMMFVVRSRNDPSRYAVVIRGTNPVSVTNWVLQDFDVFQQAPWPYHRPTNGASPKMSKGTARGLQSLQDLVPRKGVPGENTSLYKFLAGEIQSNARDRITVMVTGHSLGGALAPTLGLWLTDTQRTSDDPKSLPWDAKGKAQVKVFSFAGPSPGNADFAGYYDTRLGPDTQRIWNDFDVVPHGWIQEALSRLPELYAPHIAPNLLMRAVLWGTTVLARHGNYRHILHDSPAAKGGKVVPLLGDYVAQMIYQHTAAYPEMLGLLQEIDATLHFGYDELVHSAVVSSRSNGVKVNARLGDGTRSPPSPPPEDPTPEELRARRSSEMSRAMHHLYRVPASIVLTLLPDRMALTKLKRRTERFHARTNETQNQPIHNQKRGQSHVDAH